MALTNLFKKIVAVAYIRIVENTLQKWVKDYKHNQVKILFKKIGEDYKIQPTYYLTNPQYITIGNNFHSLYNLRLEAWDKYHNVSYNPEIIIGNNARIGSDCHIGCINKVVIKDNVLIASKVYISDHFHGEINASALLNTPLDRDLYSKGPITIEENVWIGENVVVMPGVCIGRNSIIGANTVVTKNVPSNTVVGGIPGKIIKQLDL